MTEKMKHFNPLRPDRTNSSCIAKISFLKYEGIIKKISYERRAYESVDEKRLYYVMSRKTTKKNNFVHKGLIYARNVKQSNRMTFMN